MNTLIYRVIKRLERYALGLATQRHSRKDLQKLGSDYGGWVIPTSLLSNSSVCYCVGVGEDISFEMALIDTFGCEVFAFDPTPKAVQFVHENARNVRKYHFNDVGLWSENRRMRFYEPRNPSHVSHSIVNLQGTTRFFEAQCRRLSSLMADLNHDKLDLLKLDIEGAEYEVLESILEDQVEVKILCVEFDQPTSILRIQKMLKKLSRFGYTLISLDNWNCTLVHNCS